ncbi:MAG: metallophosphatase family protein [Actinobacteria bacterium]|nr:metallophosphatase family protein [Actinomycetota bacterium]
MKYALISDIHSNLPALEAVLADIDEREDVGAIYHLGDLVGYAPWPNETVALLRERRIPGIAGNYDSTVATDYKHCGCKVDSPRGEELSHLSYEWTRAHVLPETRRVLGELPFRRYVLVEAAEEIQTIEFVRVEYDLERTAEGISESELPDEFADQLRASGTPKPVEVP